MRILSLFAALFLWAAPVHAQTWQPHDGDKLVFDVLRDGGSGFGTHTVTFQKSGDRLTVKSNVNLRVDLGPINFFEYVMDVTETYDGGKLSWVGSRTKKDGKWKTLTADATEAGLKVKGEKYKGVLTGLVVPSTHWNIAEMSQSAMFSTETGEMLKMTVTDKGMDKVKVGKTTIDAHRYFVKSDIEANFWYDAEGRWVKCAFETQGQKIEYVLRALPA